MSNIRCTAAFAQTLLKKLTVGNSRSVSLNSLPGNLTTRLPLNDLNIINETLANEFLNTLLSQRSFHFKFCIETADKDVLEIPKLSRISKRLSAIKYDHEDYLKEHGVNTFGFGFPIILRKSAKDAKKTIAAPLFIFPLNIRQSFNKEREWVISMDANTEVRTNDVLAAYFENEEHIKLPQLAEEVFEDGILDKNEILDYCLQVQRLFNADEISPDKDGITTLPEKASVDDPCFTNNGIIWNGVFSLYKNQKQSQIKEMEQLLHDFNSLNEGQETSFEWEQIHSPVLTDPSQNSVLHALKNNENIVVEGPPGTGKSQTLTALITSALANKKKVLIVCEKRTALEVLKDNLSKMSPSIANSIALVEDTVRDRGPIVENVRSRTARALSFNHSLSILRADIQRFEEKAEQIENQYKALREPQKRWWSVLVTEWIKQDRSEEKKQELYNLQNIFRKHKVAPEEFRSIASVIEDTSHVFKKIQSEISYLENVLNYDAIVASGLDSTFPYSIKNWKQKTNDIKKIVSTSKELFTQICVNNHQIELDSCLLLLNQLSDLEKRYKSKNKDVYTPSKLEKIKSIFLKSSRLYIQDSQKALQLLKQANTFSTNKLGVDFTANNQEKNIAQLKTSFLGYSERDLTSKLSSDFANLKNGEKIADQLHSVKLEITNLWKQIGGIINGISLNGRLVDIYSLEQTTADLENKLDELLRYEKIIFIYFKWKDILRKATPVQIEWLSELKSRNADSWTELLNDAWLFYSLLKEDVGDRFPTDETNLNILKDLRLKIQKQEKEIIEHNLNNWFNEGQAKVSKLGLSINQLYNLRGSKGGTRNSLRKIIFTNPDSFSDFFPVIMLNPSTCSSLLPLQKDLFDIVLFDEASQLRIEDTFTAMLRGRQAIVSGDSLQMPPSSYFESPRQLVDDNDDTESGENEDNDEDILGELRDNSAKNLALQESLLAFATEYGFRKTWLDMHYRSQHPDLIEFSNTCFYNSRLIPMPEVEHYKAISYHHVAGQYEARKNETEAKEILRILNTEIPSDASVGVATFNIDQRNLILSIIDNERSENSEFNSKMASLEANGFFVKNLENVQGDERDYILISTTFGVTKEGTFRMSFGPISGSNGHRLLNVIITRARKKMYVVTSVPESRIPEYRSRIQSKQMVDGTAGFFAYLNYSKAVSNENWEEKENILQFIKQSVGIGQKASSLQSLDQTESPFEQEVYDWLKESIGEDRIKLQYKCGGFRIDMVVLPKEKNTTRKLAIECDGAAYHSDELSWHYDLYRQQQLEANGFTFHRIWSTNWWREPEEEFRKLLQTIELFN